MSFATSICRFRFRISFVVHLAVPYSMYGLVCGVMVLSYYGVIVDGRSLQRYWPNFWIFSVFSFLSIFFFLLVPPLRPPPFYQKRRRPLIPLTRLSPPPPPLPPFPLPPLPPMPKRPPPS